MVLDSYTHFQVHKGEMERRPMLMSGGSWQLYQKQMLMSGVDPCAHGAQAFPLGILLLVCKSGAALLEKKYSFAATLADGKP